MSVSRALSTSGNGSSVSKNWFFVLSAAVALAACAPTMLRLPASPQPGQPSGTSRCGGQPLRVHFYDVEQALAVLVSLPDGRQVLVDAGDAANRTGCGPSCAQSARQLVTHLTTDLAGTPLSLLWVTHQHSDHRGGIPALVVGGIAVEIYVDNGQDIAKATVARARAAAVAAGATLVVVDPQHLGVPMEDSRDIRFTAVVPAGWPADCSRNPNECSIGLRIDYCSTSVLFTGDAEAGEEATFLTGAATLLQVGHHGSSTSTSPLFLQRVAPKYAVISAGHPGRGTNRTYCHPSQSTVTALTAALGGAGSRTVAAFDGTSPCIAATDNNWVETPASDHLWLTARDGDVVLMTTGDGLFVREVGP